jgi:hypothetical protein
MWIYKYKVIVCLKMARRLSTLIDSPCDLKANDIVYFTFKQNRFSATVTSTGLITNVKWTKPNSITENVFSLRSFESLTDWTETCIQEKLDEYHTRYSAWRRVRHARSSRPMEQIYKEFCRHKLNNNIKKLTVSEYQHLCALNNERVLFLEKNMEKHKEAIQKWKSWFEKNHEHEELPVENIEHTEKKKEHNETVQPIMLDSPSGTYLVIQRMKEVAPNAVASVKSLGLNGFRKMTDKFIKQNQTWDPPSTKEKWWEHNMTEINKDPRLIARIVHEFFKK